MTDTTADLPPLFGAQGETIGVLKPVAWSPQAKPLAGLHGWLRGALYLNIVSQTALVLITGFLGWLFAGLGGGELIVTPRLSVLVAVIGGAAQLTPWVVYITLAACIICYLRFVYRATKNLDLANARGLTISPAWAVGWSFIPFANLFMIYKVMADIWRYSRDPEKGRYDPPAIFAIWYTSRIVGSLLETLSVRTVPSGADGPTQAFYTAYVTPMAMSCAGSFLAIISTICLLRIIRQITDNQTALQHRPPT
jgi:hypothetical protein